MPAQPFTDSDAQISPEQWFRYLDVVEPIRGELHTYCLRLTQSIWGAEVLVPRPPALPSPLVRAAPMAPLRLEMRPTLNLHSKWTTQWVLIIVAKSKWNGSIPIL